MTTTKNSVSKEVALRVEGPDGVRFRIGRAERKKVLFRDTQQIETVHILAGPVWFPILILESPWYPFPGADICINTPAALIEVDDLPDEEPAEPLEFARNETLYSEYDAEAGF